MSTKGDLVTNTASAPSQKLPAGDPSAQKNSSTSSKKLLNAPPSLVLSKTASAPNKTSVNPNGNQPPLDSPTTAAINFAARFLTKSPLRALTIDTANEGSSYNVLNSNRLTSFSATHNPAPQHVHTRNSLISSLNGNLSAKYSRAIESYRRPTQISPSKTPTDSKSLLSSKPGSSQGYPFSATHQSSSKVLTTLGSDFARSLLNSLTPTGLHCKKLSTKSYSQDRNKGALYTSFDNKRAHTDQLRKICTTSALDSSRSFQANDTSQNNDQNDMSLNTIFKSLKGSFVGQTASAKKILMPIPNHEPTKCSVTRNGIVKAYAANTNQGIVRNYNEDRVSIILNIMKPASRANEEWPKCSFFGVYDGHGGVGCADFLRDNLHQYVIKEPSFPSNPKEALMKGFDAAERAFLELADGNTVKEIDRSGSCALVALIVGDMCYVANVGDSRAVMSGDGGTKIYPLSKDHKPDEENETKRIIDAGGKIYQSQAPVSNQANSGLNSIGQMQLILGPHRVLPGRLSVSRTFGDIEAKLPKFGGNPNVVIATPVIKTFRVVPDHDFIVLATDGIYDKMSSRDVVKSVWESAQEIASNIHHQSGLAVENILRESINRRTLDNITVVMITFDNFKNKLFPQEESQRSDIQEPNQNASGVISSNMVKSAVLSRSAANSSPLLVTKKEKLNLQEKRNIDEKANIAAGKTARENKITQPSPTPEILSSRTIKKPFNTPRENNFFADPHIKKENKESFPISDVNLPNKRLAAKRGNEGQKIIAANRSANQAGGELQKLTECQSMEVSEVGAIKS